MRFEFLGEGTKSGCADYTAGEGEGNEFALGVWRGRAPVGLRDNAFGFPIKKAKLDDDSDPNPCNLVLAGVYPSCNLGTGERVGTSTKKPGFFLGCSRGTARGPGGSSKKIGKLAPMG